MKILNIIYKITNNKFFSYGIIMLVIIFYIQTCNKNSSLKNDIALQNYNISVLHDSIKNEVTKSGNHIASVSGYLATKKKLEEYNTELLKQVNKQKGTVISLNNIIFQLKLDTAQLRQYIRQLEAAPPTKVNDSIWNVSWGFEYVYDTINNTRDNYDKFYGSTQIKLKGNQKILKNIKVDHIESHLTSRESIMKLTWGQKYEDGKLKIFAETNHPAFKAQLLEGVYLDPPSQSNWFTGFSVGPNISMGYNLATFQPAFIVGVGIQYNIYQWPRKRKPNLKR